MHAPPRVTAMFLFILLAVCATFAQAQTPAPANASSTAVNTSTVPPAANASGSAVNTSLLSQKPENQIPFGASAAPSAKPGAATLNGMTLLNDVLKLAVILVLVYVGLLLYKQYFMHKRGSTATATAAGSAKPQKLIVIVNNMTKGQSPCIWWRCLRPKCSRYVSACVMSPSRVKIARNIKLHEKNVTRSCKTLRKILMNMQN